MKRQLVISEVLLSAWKGLKAEFWLLTGLIIGYVIISLLLVLFIPDLKENISITAITIMILMYVFSIIFLLGYTKNLFQALDHEEPQFSAYGRQSLKIITFFISYVLYLIVVVLGTILFIVPGIYLALRLQFFTAFIVDENSGAIESFKRSWEITKGQMAPLIALALITAGFLLLGILTLTIGIFIAIPFTGLLYCATFRKLTTSIDQAPV